MTAPCEHTMTIEGAEPADRSGRRIVHLVCSGCGYALDKQTTKTDAELQAAT